MGRKIKRQRKLLLSKEANTYSKLDEDGGKMMIYKMARDRDENC